MTTTTARPVARDPAFDRTLTFLQQGYEFAPNLLRAVGADAVETRLTLHRAVLTGGREAAEMFYHPERFTRVGAMPLTTLALLQGKGSVATLSGAAHRHRKRMFLSMLDAAGVDRLTALVRAEWPAMLQRWEGRRRVAFHAEAAEVLCRAVCRWAGVPLAESEADRRTREQAALIDGSGSVGGRMVRGLMIRQRVDRWAAGLIAATRAGGSDAPADAPVRVIAAHTDPDGRPLSEQVAAKELVNLLRPTVAVAWFATFAALALHTHPTAAEFVRGGPAHAEAFAQEVRRFYPFFPLVAGRVLDPFDWRERAFRRGEWVLFDLYGTNRDSRVWDAADEFRPERFLGRADDPFSPVPQGGGEMAATHRCPGEPATVAIVAEFARLLTAECRYTVPAQNLVYPLNRIPTLPADGFVIAPA